MSGGRLTGQRAKLRWCQHDGGLTFLRPELFAGPVPPGDAPLQPVAEDGNSARRGGLFKVDDRRAGEGLHLLNVWC